MSELRARPSDICMSDAMPFQQHWEYRTTWPIKDVLHDKFFLSLRAQLRAGDGINICRYDGADINHKGISLIEFATVRVIASGAASEVVKVSLVGEIMVIGDAVEGPAEMYVRRGQAGKFRVMKGDTLIEEFGSKIEAEEALKRIAA